MKTNKYIFSSERLGFRKWAEDDLEEFSKLNADPLVMKHFPKILSKNEVLELIGKLNKHYSTNGFTYYAVELLETREFIGMIGLAFQEYRSIFTPAIDIGWRLKKSAWGKGFATEGARKCIEYAFNELELNKIIAICTINNASSENVMKKIGMKKKGEFDHPEMDKHPEYEKHLCYEIIKKKTNS